MLGTLLESRARRTRRTGGAALSVFVHIAIIGAATAATVQAKPDKKTQVEVRFIRFTAAPAPAPKPIERHASPISSTSSVSIPAPPTLTIPAPTEIPTSLPAIDLTRGVVSDAITIGNGASSAGEGRPGGSLDLTNDGPDASDWRGSEVLMHIVSSAKPRYPETLRQAGIDGGVLVQFIVDTTGRVDMNSVKVLRSTHELFTLAVRSSLPQFRFKPAEVGGRRAVALAEMPFQFEVKR